MYVTREERGGETRMLLVNSGSILLVIALLGGLDLAKEWIRRKK